MGWDRESFHRRPPRAVRGGIKARAGRGGSGGSWWTRRWLEALEALGPDGRLERGRASARKGQVAELEIAPGVARARVQGSRARPYTVTVRLKPLRKADWRTVAAGLASQARYAARLLAGEMPEDIETVFRAAGLNLFPAPAGDLTTECSCPDWSNPCKHVAAVYDLLAEEIERDPFTLLRLRGLDRRELVALLGQEAAGVGRAQRSMSGAPPEGVSAAPLPVEPERFWGAPGPSETAPLVATAGSPAALLARLGGFPFWRGQRLLGEALARHYRNAPEIGLAVMLGEGLSRKTTPSLR